MKVQQQPEGTIRVIATVIAIATLVCGSIGWALKFGVSLETLPVIVVRTIWLFIPRPEVMSDPANNTVLKAGATLGALSGGVGAFAIWMAAANAKLSHLLTRFVRRGHTLVIGNTPLAFRLVRALKSENAVPVHVTDVLVLRQERKTDDLRMTLDLTPETLARKAGLLRASSVVIDMGNDADTMVTAKPILRWLERNGPGTVRHMTVRIADPFLADMFLEFSQKIGLGKLVRVSAFDENRVAARHALSSQPLFVRAAARGQSRVHALIVGFGDFGEKLFDQIMLTSIAGDLEQPRVTIVDKDAGRLQREFATRRPGVCESLDVSFIEMDIGAVPLEGAYVGEQVAGLVLEVTSLVYDVVGGVLAALDRVLGTVDGTTSEVAAEIAQGVGDARAAHLEVAGRQLAGGRGRGQGELDRAGGGLAGRCCGRTLEGCCGSQERGQDQGRQEGDAQPAQVAEGGGSVHWGAPLIPIQPAFSNSGVPGAAACGWPSVTRCSRSASLPWTSRQSPRPSTSSHRISWVPA